MEKIEIPYYADKKELFKFLKTNKDRLEAQKKFTMKTGDGIPFNNIIYDGKNKAVNKANTPILMLPDEYKVQPVINTTNFVDSHMDGHLPGIWDKSLKENRMIMHLQEHNRGFAYIISDGDDLKAYVKDITWKELGFDYKGTTQALLFDSVLKRAGQKPRNEYMTEQYAKAYVRNHSVGMQYIKMVLCINQPDDEYYGAEFEAWEKYAPQMVNQEYLNEKGFFWAIKEAKVIEGSAVPIGSNIATPTLDNNLKREPSNHSQKPLQDTSKINYGYLAEKFKL